MSQRRHAITLSDGTVVFDLSGGDGEDEDEDTDEDEDDAQEGDGSDEDGDGEEDELSVEDLKQQLQEALTKSADYERRMRMADRTAARYRTENEGLKKGTTQKEADGEQSKDDEIKRLKAQLAERQSGDSRSQVRDAFDAMSKQEWQNRRVAFDLLDISDVGIDDRGRVDQQALDDAVAKLAQEHPYLVKTAEKDARPKPPARPSGSQPGAHRRDRNSVDRKQLESKYPQLLGRS